MNTKTLTEGLTEFLNLQVKIIENNGELTPELEQEIALNEQSIAVKAERYKFVIDQCKAQIPYYRERAAEMNRIASGLQHVEEFLKNNLKNTMMAMEVAELTAGSVKAKLVKCPKKLIIEDEKAIPPSYTEVSVKVISERVKADLEAGLEVPGATLVGGLALRFFPNKEMK